MVCGTNSHFDKGLLPMCFVQCVNFKRNTFNSQLKFQSSIVWLRPHYVLFDCGLPGIGSFNVEAIIWNRLRDDGLKLFRSSKAFWIINGSSNVRRCPPCLWVWLWLFDRRDQAATNEYVRCATSTNFPRAVFGSKRAKLSCTLSNTTKKCTPPPENAGQLSFPPMELCVVRFSESLKFGVLKLLLAYYSGTCICG